MKKLKFEQEKTKNGVWSDWIFPVMNNYHMSCCDCGLVHTINFRALKFSRKKKKGTVYTILPKGEYRIEFKVRRNEKYTKQERSNK